MRLQLRRWWTLALLLGVAGKPAEALAQSTVKFKKLRYDEQAPGITVDEDALEVVLDLQNEDQANLFLLHDAISGASPTGLPANDTTSGASTTAGRGQQFATFDDERYSATAGYAHKLDRTTTLNGQLHYSREDDYLSRGLTLGTTFELNRRNTTLSPSVSYYRDRVQPSNDKPDADKTVTTFAFNATQVLNSWNLVTLGLDFTRSSGYLTDPYKQVLVGGVAMDEQRPDTRMGSSVTVGWRTQPFERHAFDLKLRHYQDDWGIASDTLKLKSLHELGDDWILEIFYRYYQQSAASFWDDRFDTLQPERSADPRLARFIATTLGTTAIYKLSEAWWLEGSYARYQQSAQQSAKLPVGNQDALVTADVYSLAVQYRFW